MASQPVTVPGGRIEFIGPPPPFSDEWWQAVLRRRRRKAKLNASAIGRTRR